MQCKDVMANLAAYHSGALPPESFRAMQVHIAECPVCRTALTEADALAGILFEAETPPVPSNLAERVLMSARQRHALELTANWNPRAWWRLTSPAMHFAAAAMLLVGLSVGLLMGWTAAGTIHRAPGRAPGDPFDIYRFDHVSEASGQSLAGNYLMLAAGTDGKGS